jgi:hypothetical protein
VGARAGGGAVATVDPLKKKEVNSMMARTAFVIGCVAALSACHAETPDLSVQDYKDKYDRQIVAELDHYSKAIFLSREDALEPKSHVAQLLYGGYMENLGLIVAESPGLDGNLRSWACSNIRRMNDKGYLEAFSGDTARFSRVSYALMKCAR